jgi:hypothetical protein
MTERDRTDDSRVVSYLTIRKAIGIIGFFLPFVLILGKIYYFEDPGIQDSISGYYYTDMRDVLVGSLCATGVFLISYKGYDAPAWRRLRFVKGPDDLASTVAGIGAIGVALFPTQPTSATLAQLAGSKSYAGVHVVSAGVFFIILAYILIFRFTDHGPSEDEPGSEEEQRIAEARRRRCNIVYVLFGGLILLSIALIVVVWRIPGGSFTWQRYSVLVLETVAILAFSIAWFLKGSEFLKRVMGGRTGSRTT